MSVLNNTLVNGVVTQTVAASQPTHLVRLQEAQALLLALFKGAWSNATTYTQGQMTWDAGGVYVLNAASSLNQEPSLNLSVWGLVLSGGTNGTNAYVYIGYASDNLGTNFSLGAPLSSSTFVAFLASSTVIASPTGSNFAGLWQQYVATGATGAAGAAGANGTSAYLYIGYASDTSGTNFSTTPGTSLNYVAFLSTNTFIGSLTAANFTGLWKNYGAGAFTVTSPITFTGGALALNCASAATANYLVQRDGSGNFAGNVVTAASLVLGSVTASVSGGALALNAGLVVPALTVGAGTGLLAATAGVVSTTAATTDVLPQGVTNLYFTTAQVLATTLTGISSTNVLAASNSILVAMGKIDNYLGGNWGGGTHTGNVAITGTLTVSGQTTLATSLTGVLLTTAGVVSGGATTTNLNEPTSGAVNLYHTAARVLATTLTGFAAAAGTVGSSDTILSALQKLQYGVTALQASAPLTAVLTGLSVGGSVAAITASDSVLSAFGKIQGTLTNLTTTNVAQGTNLYFTTTAVLGTTLTGFTAGTGTVTGSDTILSALQKAVGNFNGVLGTALAGFPVFGGANGGAVTSSDTILSAIQRLNGMVTTTTLTGFTPTTGTVTSADTVLSALQKLQYNVTALQASALGTVLTGFTAGAGTVSSSDTILTAFQKLQGSMTAVATTYVPLAGAVTITGTLTHSATVVFAGTSNPGLIVNNLSTAQRTALATTNNGNLVYDTTLQALMGLVNGVWVQMGGSYLPLAGGSTAKMTGAMYFLDGLAANIWFGNSWNVNTTATNAYFNILAGTTYVLACQNNGNVNLPNGVLQIAGTQVLKAQQATALGTVADFTAAGGWSDSVGQADFSNLVAAYNALVGKFNTLTAALIAHGLVT